VNLTAFAVLLAVFVTGFAMGSIFWRMADEAADDEGDGHV